MGGDDLIQLGGMVIHGSQQLVRKGIGRGMLLRREGGLLGLKGSGEGRQKGRLAGFAAGQLFLHT